MRAIFISYRREDTEGQARRLFGALTAHFGEDHVFMDASDIEHATIQRTPDCAVRVALIGHRGLDLKRQIGRPRLDDPLDFVRLKSQSAVECDVPVIPVLVQGASMPRAEQLPPDLAYRSSVELTLTRWDTDVQLLIKALSAHVTPLDGHGATTISTDGMHASTVAYPTSRMPMIAIAVASLIAIGLIVFSGLDQAKHKQRGGYENAADAVNGPFEH